MSQRHQRQFEKLSENCCIGGKIFGPCTECAGSPRNSQNCQYCLGAGTTWYPCPSCTGYTSTGAVSFGGSSNHQATYSSSGGSSSATEWQGQHGYGSTKR